MRNLGFSSESSVVQIFGVGAASECLSKRDMQRRWPFLLAVRQQLPRELDAQVDADRADRRFVSNAESDRGAQLAEVDVVDVGKYVSHIEKSYAAEIAQQRRAKLGVQHDQAMPALREAIRVDGVGPAQPIEREAAHGGVATRKKSLAGGQVVHDLTDGFAGLAD